MAETTTAVTGLSFEARDAGAGAVADKLGHSFQKLHDVTEKARAKIGEFGRDAAMGALASVGLGFGLHSLFEKATEANSEMARVTKSVAGVQYAFQGWRPGLTSLDKMNYSMQQGADNAEKLHAIGLKLRAPIDDMAATYNQVAAVGFGRLRMSQEGVLDLTEKITAASKVYGISGVEAIEKVHRTLLTGTVSQRDVSGFSETLREALGVTKKGQHLTPDEIMRRVQKGLGDMVPAARRMGDSMEGSLFEAKMLVDQMLRDLTGPMFKEQTKSLSEWVQKIRTVREDGKSILQVYGEKLAGAFDKLKSVTAFIVDHWKTLLALYATSKFSTAMSGWAGNAAAASAATIGAGVGNVLKPSLASTTSKLAGLASKVALVTEGMAAYYGVLQIAWSYGEKLGDMMAKQSPQLDKGLLGASPRAMAQYAQMAGFENNSAALTKAFAEMSAEDQNKWAEKLGAAKTRELVTGGGPGGGYGTFVERTATPEALADAFGKSVARELMLMRTPDVLMDKGNMLSWGPGGPNMPKRAPQGNININNLTITQDFREADPDRVFHKVSAEISQLGHGSSRFHIASGV